MNHHNKAGRYLGENAFAEVFIALVFNGDGNVVAILANINIGSVNEVFAELDTAGDERQDGWDSCRW